MQLSKIIPKSEIKKLLNLASLIGTDAKEPEKRLITMIENIIVINDELKNHMKHNLKSTALQVGRYADHIIQFENGEQKTFENIDNESIKVGKFTKMKNKDGYLIGVAHDKVNWFEVHPIKEGEKNDINV